MVKSNQRHAKQFNRPSDARSRRDGIEGSIDLFYWGPRPASESMARSTLSPLATNTPTGWALDRVQASRKSAVRFP
jgi:hypothetical protein